MVQTYGSAPDYGWHPVTMTPEYLTIHNPDFDFVTLAKAFGVGEGRVVRKPSEVYDAVRDGVAYVMESGRSYVLDVRTNPNPPSTPVGVTESAKGKARRSAPPALDVFFRSFLAGDDAELDPTEGQQAIA